MLRWWRSRQWRSRPRSGIRHTRNRRKTSRIRYFRTNLDQRLLESSLNMSLIVVGSVAYDGVETPHGKVDRMLGGSATYISLAASYFTTVKIVAVVGNDFAQEDADLLRCFGSEGAGVVPRGAVSVSGQHPTRSATERARPDGASAPQRRRHHELLDRWRFPRRAARNHQAMGLPADQRQRSTAAFGRTEHPPRRRQDSHHGAENPGH